MPSAYSSSIPAQEYLAATRSAWLDKRTISNEANGAADLHGPIVDWAALHGVLIKIRDLSLPLVAVTTVATDES